MLMASVPDDAPAVRSGLSMFESVQDKPFAWSGMSGIFAQGPRSVFVGRHGLSPEAEPMSATDGLDVQKCEAAFAPWGAGSRVGDETCSLLAWVT